MAIAETKKIKITDKINENQLNQAMDIYYFAFKQKIRPLIKSKEKAIEIYKKGLNADRVFYAVIENNVVGLAGLHYENKNFIDVEYSNLRKHFNPFSSYFIYSIYKLISPKIREDVLRIDSLAVKESVRGFGIGSQLIDKVFQFAKSKGFNEVILEVVDTNPRAKKLYEKVGFKEKRLIKYYFLARSAGFSSEHIMSYKMKNYS
jgi:GNAT superfamily N-acetyltransferase